MEGKANNDQVGGELSNPQYWSRFRRKQMKAARAYFRKWLETDGHLELKQEQEDHEL